VKKSFSILFPKVPAIPIILYTYKTGVRRRVELGEAKSLILGALLRGDMVFNDSVFKEDAETMLVLDSVISVVDKAEHERATQKIMESDALVTKDFVGRTVFVVPEQVRGVVKRVNINTGQMFIEFEPDPLHFPDGKYDGWYDISEVKL